MHSILWEFQVRPGREEDFEHLYGEQGDWVQFFHRGEGYLGSALLRDLETVGRYVTIDRWVSQEAYQDFRRRWAAEYAALDQQCASLTLHEARIGAFRGLRTED